MVNTVATSADLGDENADARPQLPPKRINIKHMAPPRAPPTAPQLSPPTYDAPPPPVIELQRLGMKDEGAGLMSDGDDYLFPDDKLNRPEAIYTSLEVADYHKYDAGDQSDDYDDVEYINMPFLRPPPPSKDALNAAEAKATQNTTKVQADNNTKQATSCAGNNVNPTKSASTAITAKTANTANSANTANTANTAKIVNSNALQVQAAKSATMNQRKLLTGSPGKHENKKVDSTTRNPSKYEIHKQMCLADRIHQFENF